MKTALWLYLFLFIAFFDLHAQYPILTPFAISLGAAPTFIGWMMGIYSLTHLPGNLMAGPKVDKHGSRRYIMFSLTAARPDPDHSIVHPYTVGITFSACD